MKRLPSAGSALLVHVFTLLACLAARPAHAQDTATGAPPAASEQPAAGGTTTTAPAAAGETGAEPGAAQPAEQTAPPPARTQPRAQPAEPPPPPPIMVVALPTGRVPPETVDAVRAAIVAQIEPMAGGRAVRPLLAPELEAALAACADAPCVGQQIAGAGAIGAIVARLSRRAARGPIDLRVEMVDPVSGAARVEPIVYSLPPEADVAASLAPLIEQLRPAMFSPPPPPPTILVTVNVDGATVRIDDQSIGESPVAAQTVAPGRHTIVVQRDGYMMFRRDVEADPGETERVDVTLQSLQAAGIDPRSIEGGGAADRGPEWYEHWGFWTGVGAGVVVIGVVIGVSVAVASSDQGPPPDPQGIPLPPIR